VNHEIHKKHEKNMTNEKLLLSCRDNSYRIPTKDSLKKSMENNTACRNILRLKDCRDTDMTSKKSRVLWKQRGKDD